MLPKSITLNNKKYKIIIIDQIRKSKTYIGWVDYLNYEILIKKDKESEMIKSLYHELVHILFAEYCIKTRDKKVRKMLFKLDKNENFIERFAKDASQIFEIKKQ